jgi:putative Mn2+ efflux pump MntP
VAIAVLVAFGIYTLVGADEGEDERLGRLARLHGPAVLLLGISISLDELAIGFTFGLLKLPVVLVIVLIAVQAFVVTQLGLRLGHRLSERFREGAERLAGAALIILGVILLVEQALS